MKALLLKDYYILSKQLKVLFLLFLFVGLFGTKSSISYLVIMGIALPLSVFSYDELAKWNNFAIMLPYSVKEIVFSKYLFAYCFMIYASLFTLIRQMISGFIFDFIIFEMTMTTGKTFVFIFLAFIMTAINIPLIFKYGSQKGGTIFLMITFFVAFITGILVGLYSPFPSEVISKMPAIMFILAVISNIVSINISINILKNRAQLL